MEVKPIKQGAGLYAEPDFSENRLALLVEYQAADASGYVVISCRVEPRSRQDSGGRGNCVVV